jgi:hypothetical protein
MARWDSSLNVEFSLSFCFKWSGDVSTLESNVTLERVTLELQWLLPLSGVWLEEQKEASLNPLLLPEVWKAAMLTTITTNALLEVCYSAATICDNGLLVVWCTFQWGSSGDIGETLSSIKSPKDPNPFHLWLHLLSEFQNSPLFTRVEKQVVFRARIELTFAHISLMISQYTQLNWVRQFGKYSLAVFPRSKRQHQYLYTLVIPTVQWRFFRQKWTQIPVVPSLAVYCGANYLPFLGFIFSSVKCDYHTFFNDLPEKLNEMKLVSCNIFHNFPFSFLILTG